MNTKFKDYFTTSASNDKSFKQVKNITTYTKAETGKWIPKFRNTHTLCVQEELKGYGQIGNGTNHKVRGSFVVDCDYPYTADYLLNLFSRYFVKPSTILRNPESNHCQVHFFFSKDIVVYRGYIPCKKHTKYMEYARKLNSWQNLGDTKWTGYWMKNPFSDKWILEYDSQEEYPFEALCSMIDELPETITERNWNEYEEINVETLADMALGSEISDPFVDEYGVRRNFKKFEKLYRDPTDKEKVKYEEEIEEEKEIEEKRIKEENRGKFKLGSENRHSTLFHIMKTNISMYNYDNEYVMKLALVYNTFFDKPLSEKELNAEVFNETTLKRTFNTLRNWRKANRDRKEEEAEMMSEIEYGDIYELRMRGYSIKGILRLVKEYWPEFDSTSLEKEYKEMYKGKYEGKYEGRYEGRYEGKYEETKAKDKIRSKVRDWMKHHNVNDKKPKSWGNVELELLKELMR